MVMQRRRGADNHDVELARTVNVAGLESMRPVARGLTVLYVFYTVNYILAPDHPGNWMALISAVTAVAYGVLPAALDRLKPPVEWRAPISMAMSVPILVNVLAALAFSRNPVFTCFVMLAVVASGAFFDRVREVLAVFAVALAGWSAVALTSPPSDDWITAASAMISSGVVAVLILWVRQQLLRRVAGLQSELRASALNDDLTGLCNRRGFLLLAEQARATADLSSKPMTLMFIDINGFKAVNDSQGHARGDAVLLALADALRATFRDGDILGRLGGDEFCVLLPGIDDSADAIDRVRRATGPVEAIPTLSIGASVYWPHEPRPITALLSDADQGMYHEKRQQRSAPAPASLH